MYVMGYPWTTGWIFVALGLFFLAGACWLPVVWLQIQIKKSADIACETRTSLHQNRQYRRYMKLRFILGWPAFIAVIIIFYLMVFKPSF